jgi:hypothetical protein
MSTTAFELGLGVKLEKSAAPLDPRMMALARKVMRGTASARDINMLGKLPRAVQGQLGIFNVLNKSRGVTSGVGSLAQTAKKVVQ